MSSAERVPDRASRMVSQPLGENKPMIGYNVLGVAMCRADTRPLTRPERQPGLKGEEKQKQFFYSIQGWLLGGRLKNAKVSNSVLVSHCGKTIKNLRPAGVGDARLALF